MILPCPTRSLLVRGFLARRRPAWLRVSDSLSKGLFGHSFCPTTTAHLLLELFVDGVQSIFDSDALQVSSCHFQSEGKVKVDFLDGGCGQHLFEGVLVFYG
jgi:hypothetical protein